MAKKSRPRTDSNREQRESLLLLHGSWLLRWTDKSQSSEAKQRFKAALRQIYGDHWDLTLHIKNDVLATNVIGDGIGRFNRGGLIGFVIEASKLVSDPPAEEVLKRLKEILETKPVDSVAHPRRIPATLVAQNEKRYWAPHNVSLLIDAVRSAGVTYEELGQLLHVPIGELTALAARRRVRVRIDSRRLQALVVNYGLFDDPSKLDPFLAAPNYPDGWRLQLSLSNRQTDSGRRLRDLIKRKFFLAGRGWLTEAEKLLLEKINPSSFRYRFDLAQLYQASAIRMSPEDMLSAARADFTHEFWMKRISIEPSQTNNHLAYSNQQMAKQVAGYLLSRANVTSSDTTISPQPIRVLEGGVGGGHSIFWLLRELYELAVERGVEIPEIEYRGFELVGDLAAMANSRMNLSHDEIGERQELFAKYHADNALKSISTGADEGIFVDNLPMEWGLADLTHHTNKFISSLGGTFDLFLCSYAFHHVPNSEGLRSYLNGDAHSMRLRCLSDETPEFQRAFQTSIVEGLGRFRNEVPRCRVLEDCAGVPSPQRVFLSRFITHGMRGVDYEELIDFVKHGLPKNGWRFPRDGNSIAFSRIKDHQRDVLDSVFTLLKNEGLVVIADPDGTSFFNATNIVLDAELMIANFLPPRSLIELLEASGFCVNPERNWAPLVTIGRNENKEYYSYPGEPRRILLDGSPDGADPNLGYIVSVEKPRGIHYGND